MKNVKVNTPEMANYLVEKGFKMLGSSKDKFNPDRYIYWFAYERNIYSFIKMYWELGK